MIIPIHIPVAGSSSLKNLPPQLAMFGTDEMVLIELQGTLEVEGDKRGQVVGKLIVDTAAKKSTLRIGHHLLEGKLVNLPKPLAILHRAQTGDGRDLDLHADADERNQSAAAWEVKAVVKRKMVFSKRPMPMVESGSASGVEHKAGKKG